MKSMRPITTMKLFDAESIAAGGNATSPAIDLREIAQKGFFSIFYTITGTGTAKIEYLGSSEKDGTFVEPSGASDVGSTLAAGSDLLSFNPELMPFMKIKVTEDGGSNAIGVTLWINIQ